jgi:hypothetical protein
VSLNDNYSIGSFAACLIYNHLSRNAGSQSRRLIAQEYRQQDKSSSPSP